MTIQYKTMFFIQSFPIKNIRNYSRCLFCAVKSLDTLSIHAQLFVLSNFLKMAFLMLSSSVISK